MIKPLVLAASGCALMLCGAARRAAPLYVPVAQAAEAVAAPQPAAPAFAPMAYFDEHCARCHGPDGSFYGKDFGKNLTDQGLHDIVHDMAEGPGGAPLKGDQLEAETAYQRAIIVKTPFVAVTKGGAPATGAPATLEGEATPGSAVSIVAGAQTIVAKLDNFKWTAALPASIDAATVQIVAKKDGTQTTLKLREGAWSHDTAMDKAP